MEIHEIREYMSWNIQNPEFFVQDIIPKGGVMLIYGRPKTGKSWLVQHLAFCLATGEDWLGFKTEQARVILCNFEISPIAYAWRLKNMFHHFELPEQMLFEVSPMLLYLDETENFNKFKAAISTVSPRIIILDCLAACFGGDENDGSQIARWIEKMQELKTINNAALVIVHHTNKSNFSDDTVDKARGHSRLAGWVDTLVFLANQPGGVQLQIKARQATRELKPINVKFEDYTWIMR